ncbi:MFS transporter [Acuticoccus sp. MNP-M23]|uniref:MFS transporter n=1 Tax=Acuticoccus sp. MNP-M23 TaxID=3072793 RepID=UPI002814DC15|nr:MFS transporter [Acuticoccus sp. MNP-M23]WMS42642.1 MFS transporter [Acuticoccus sp. MNP-M23]
MKINLPLVALATGAFGIGVTEFAPMGMLPVMAADLGISIPAAGLLVSAYAIGVLAGAPLMILTTGRMRRRSLLIALAGIFTAGNALSAVSGSYELLVMSRLITALNHGAFFGVGAVVAAGLVTPDKRAAAVATMFMGLAVANVVGVPLASYVGEAIDWRTVFWGIAALGVVTMAALRFTLPDAPAPQAGNALAELKVLSRGSVLAAFGLTVLGSSAMFTVFTYIAPILQGETGVSAIMVSVMLVIYGLGLALGNWLGGYFADRSVDMTLAVALGSVSVILFVFAGLMHYEVATALIMAVWGVATFAMIAPMQMRVMGAAADAPNLASAVNIGAFNLGNAIGAALGGAVISAGLGYPAVSLTGAVMAALGLAAVFLTRERAPQPVLCDRAA